MVTDMRRCILANVGSAVLALSTFLTVLKKKMSRRGFFCTVFSFCFFSGCQNSWFTCCLLSLHNTALCKHYNTALHCTTEHCNALESLASTRRRLPLLLPPALDSSRLDSTRSLRMRPPCTAPVRALNKFRLRCQQRTEQRVESRRVELSPSPNEAHNGAYEQCCSCVVCRLRLLLFFCCCCCCCLYLFLANGLLFLFSLLFAVVF